MGSVPLLPADFHSVRMRAVGESVRQSVPILMAAIRLMSSAKVTELTSHSSTQGCDCTEGVFLCELVNLVLAVVVATFFSFITYSSSPFPPLREWSLTVLCFVLPSFLRSVTFIVRSFVVWSMRQLGLWTIRGLRNTSDRHCDGRLSERVA